MGRREAEWSGSSNKDKEKKKKRTKRIPIPLQGVGKKQPPLERAAEESLSSEETQISFRARRKNSEILRKEEFCGSQQPVPESFRR